MKEATKLASTTELEDIGERLEHKSRVFAELLRRGAPGRELTEVELKQLLSWVFSLRRKTSRLLQHNSLETIRTELKALLHGGDAVPTRFDRFLDSVGGLDRAMIVSLASEALHFSDPRRYWLWTHWVWNPGNGTGCAGAGDPGRCRPVRRDRWCDLSQGGSGDGADQRSRPRGGLCSGGARPLSAPMSFWPASTPSICTRFSV